MRSICVFCGSMMGNDPAYKDLAAQTGAAIGQSGTRLIYGGGDIGLMGVVANAALAAKGEVLGVIPEFLKDRENAHEDVELRVVATMSARKAMMIEEADGFIVLPGGTGTLEEVFDMLSRRRLGQHDKPVAFLGASYWAPLKAMLDQVHSHAFAPNGAAEGFLFTDSVEDAMACVGAKA